MTQPRRILKPVICIDGYASSLAVIRSLGERGVPVVVAEYDRGAFAGTSRFARARIALPDPVTSEPAFVTALAEHAGRWGGSILIPCSDQALVAVARNKARLARDYIVGCEGWDEVRQVIEKRHTYEIANSIGVDAPRTVHPRSMDDVALFAETAVFPCLVKPDQGHLFRSRFGRQSFSAADATELTIMYQRAVDEGFEVLLQEFIPGADLNGSYISSYRSGSRVLASFTVAKVRNAPPYYGSPRVVVSRRIPELEYLTQRLLDAIGLEGFACTEYKRDPRDGSYKLMEVNARFNQSALLAVHCGVDFPWIHYQHLVGGEELRVANFKSGVYWIDFHSDIKQTLGNIGREPMSPIGFLRPYARPHVFAVHSLRDPGPMLRLVANVAGRALRRLEGHARSILGPTTKRR